MINEKGYIDASGLVPLFWIGVIAIISLVVLGPMAAYTKYQDHKEEQQLIAECERNLPRDQHCIIVKVAKLEGGE